MLHPEVRAEKGAEPVSPALPSSGCRREEGHACAELEEHLCWRAGAASTSTVQTGTCAVTQREKHIISTGYTSLLLLPVEGIEVCLVSPQMHRRSFSVDTSQLTLSQYFSICFIQVEMMVCNKISIPCFATMPYPSRRILF